MRIAIIGAGLGGVAVAVKLGKAGFDDFVVYEKSAGPGGTWWDNRYPGAQVDIASHLYSFSFMPYSWRGTHAYQAEVQQYVEDTIDHFGIRRKFQFDSQVTDVTWGEDHTYRVTLESGEEQSFDVVVSCVGMLNVPKYPDWCHDDVFRGPIFHTARWEHEHDLEHKRVAVVGTGSSAAQVVPALADSAGHVVVFQREPGWVLPKKARDFAPEERRRFAKSRWRQRGKRLQLAIERHDIYKAFRVGSELNSRLAAQGLGYLETAVDDPEVRSLLTPQYPFGCKRIVMDDNYLPAFNLEQVTLVPREVVGLTASGVVDSAGTTHEVDVVVLATGFDAQNYLSTFTVRGRNKTSLKETWNGDPTAVLGMMVPGFPNFFILYGPNTNGGGTILVNLEMQADVVVRQVRRMGRRRKTSYEVRPLALSWWSRWIDRRNEELQSAAMGSCRNYYFSRSGRNVTQYPGSHLEHRLLAHLIPRIAMRADEGRDWRHIGTLTDDIKAPIAAGQRAQ